MNLKNMKSGQKKKALTTYIVTAVVCSIILLVLIFINAVRC